MVHAAFSDEEARMMKEALENYLSELNSEMFVTDSLTFKHVEDLTHKKAIVVDMIGKLEGKAA
jgi:hypothetical protein